MARTARNHSAATSEKRSFTMHPQLLFSVIERQAGTLSKAILEGVMNGVDARARRIEVRVDESGKKITISDDGKGFRSREEIEKFFETFGQPHDASEGKIYGAFRMGRGQMFAFGRNRWRTGEFAMDVDIKGKGLDYDLQEGLESVQGCTIEIDLYKRLYPSDISVLERDIKQAVKWVDIPVTFNDQAISQDPAKAKWDIETEDAYIKLRENGRVAVYNLGVFVREYPSYTFGTGGEVVAKKQLKVNFARNDVQSDCGVWKRIKKHLDQRAKSQVKKKAARKLNPEERQYAAEQIKTGEIARGEARKLKVLTDVTGEHWSFEKLDQHLRRYKIRAVTTAPLYDHKADKLMQQRTHFVLAEETLERFGVESVEELFRIAGQRDLSSLLARDAKAETYEEATAALAGHARIVPDHLTTPSERMMIEFLDTLQWDITPNGSRRRTLRVGESDIYDAWTDGATYIALNRRFLRNSGSVEQWVGLGQLLLHEYCHDEVTYESHVHGPDFYRAYHDQWPLLQRFTANAFARFPEFLRKQGKKLTRTQLKQADLPVRLEQAQATYVSAGGEAPLSGDEVVNLHDPTQSPVGVNARDEEAPIAARAAERASSSTQNKRGAAPSKKSVAAPVAEQLSVF